MNNSKTSDKISTKILLDNMNMMSINQWNAQIKLTKIWKPNNKANYPLLLPKQTSSDKNKTTRACSTGRLFESRTKPIMLKHLYVMLPDSGTRLNLLQDVQNQLVWLNKKSRLSVKSYQANKIMELTLNHNLIGTELLLG